MSHKQLISLLMMTVNKALWGPSNVAHYRRCGARQVSKHTQTNTHTHMYVDASGGGGGGGTMY